MENFEWNNLSVGEPYWLFLLLLLPGVLWLSRRKKKIQAIKFPSIVEIKTTRKIMEDKTALVSKAFILPRLSPHYIINFETKTGSKYSKNCVKWSRYRIGRRFIGVYVGP